MPGRVTFRKPDGSLADPLCGELVAPLNLTKAGIAELEAALDRPLPPAASDSMRQTRESMKQTLRLLRAVIAELEAALGRPLPAAVSESMGQTLPMLRAAIRSGGAGASMQDVKRTLAALARLDDAEALAAHAALDPLTRALVDAERPDGREANAVQRAAGAALANLPASMGGRPPNDAELQVARCAVAWWKAAGGTPATIFLRREQQSPLLRFAVAVFSTVHPLSPHQVVKLLAADKP